MEKSHRHSVGFIRREFIQVGFSGLLGMGLTDLLWRRARAAGVSRRGRASRAPRRSR